MEIDESQQPGPRIVAATGAIDVGVAATATAAFRTLYAISHIKSARRFVGLLTELEVLHEGQGWGEHFEDARTYATAAIILSFSAVEAAINEALDDLGIEGELHSLIERASTIDAAQALLIHLRAPQLDRGSEPTQSLNLLRQIRNGLVHARGEWSDVEGGASRLSARIVDANLPLSPFHPDPRWAFERGIMSAGTASWAVRTARTFIDQFRQNAGLTPLPLGG